MSKLDDIESKLKALVVEFEQLKKEDSNEELFDFQKHMIDFIQGDIAINCKTKNAANDLFEALNSLGVTWCDGTLLKENTHWDDFSNACYSMDNNGIQRSDKNYYETEGYKIVVFK